MKRTYLTPIIYVTAEDIEPILAESDSESKSMTINDKMGSDQLSNETDFVAEDEEMY